MFHLPTRLRNVMSTSANPQDYVDSINHSSKVNDNSIDKSVYNRIILNWNNLSIKSIEMLRNRDDLRVPKQDVIDDYKQEVTRHIHNNIKIESKDFLRAIDRLAIEVSIIIRVADIFFLHYWYHLPDKTQDIVRVIGGKSGKLGKRKKLYDNLLKISNIFNHSGADYERVLFKDYVQFSVIKHLNRENFQFDNFVDLIDVVLKAINQSSVANYEIDFKKRIDLSKRGHSNYEAALAAFNQSYDLCFQSYTKKELAKNTCVEIFEKVYLKYNKSEKHMPEIYPEKKFPKNKNLPRN